MSDTNQPETTPGNQGKKTDEKIRYVPVEYVDYSDSKSQDEVSLIDLIKIIWDGRYSIIKVIVFFTALGLFVFLFGERQYTSEAVLFEEQRQNQLSSNRLLQQFGGGALDFQTEGIPSSLYPTIIGSADFLLGIIEYKVEFESLETELTPKEYFNEYYTPPLTERTSDFILDYTIKLPITIYKGIRSLVSGNSSSEVGGEITIEAGSDIRFLSLEPEQRRAISMMRERINLEQNTGLATFTVDMPDAKAAAEINLYVTERIQDYIIDYRIQKYRQNLIFVEKQLEDARIRYEEAQLRLAQFRDRNVNISTAVQRIEQEDLENRRNITFNVYNNLAQELEQTRTRLQEETPVFNVLQKPSLPHRLSNRSPLILILTIFVGGIMGIFLVFLLHTWNMIRSQLMGNVD